MRYTFEAWNSLVQECNKLRKAIFGLGYKYYNDEYIVRRTKKGKLVVCLRDTPSFDLISSYEFLEATKNNLKKVYEDIILIGKKENRIMELSQKVREFLGDEDYDFFIEYYTDGR